MADFIGVIPVVLDLGLPIAGYFMVRRNPGHTRGQLVAGAGVGGGLAGAVSAVLASAGGTSFGDALPFAVVGLANGLIVGLLGVGAFALGRWLGREP